MHPHSPKFADQIQVYTRLAGTCRGCKENATTHKTRSSNYRIPAASWPRGSCGKHRGRCRFQSCPQTFKTRCGIIKFRSSRGGGKSAAEAGNRAIPYIAKSLPQIKMRHRGNREVVPWKYRPTGLQSRYQFSTVWPSCSWASREDPWVTPRLGAGPRSQSHAD